MPYQNKASCASLYLLTTDLAVSCVDAYTYSSNPQSQIEVKENPKAQDRSRDLGCRRKLPFQAQRRRMTKPSFFLALKTSFSSVHVKIT